jgi:hypothetical protein
MIQRIQKRPKWQRVIIFSLLLLIVLFAIFLLTLGVAYLGVNSGPRNNSIAIQDSITVREWAVLPGDDAYPAALALDPAGNVYTGSYVTGAVWRITPDGVVTELPQTRDTFGAVAGLVWGDNALYVLDRNSPLAAASMTLWRWQDGAAPEKLRESQNTDRFPYDLDRDADGNLYVSFVFAGQESEIMRYPIQGEEELWWTAPTDTIVTGIAYDEVRERLIAVDTQNSNLYAIPLSNPNTSSLLYEHTLEPQPGFGDATVAPDGTIYLASLDLNRVAALSAENDLTYLAGAFRGSSRVAYDAAQQRLYVNNFDNRSLLADQVLFVQVDVTPKLPFALDLVEWK